MVARGPERDAVGVGLSRCAVSAVLALGRGCESQLGDVLPEPDTGGGAAVEPSADDAPKWSSVSGGHAYSWHDGRLHALATVALAPGASYVGRWSIPVRINARAGAIAGGLWHASDPSIVWFWPIVVLLACVLAARRVRSPGLDRRPGACARGRRIDRERGRGRGPGASRTTDRLGAGRDHARDHHCPCRLGACAGCCSRTPGTSRISRSRSWRCGRVCSSFPTLTHGFVLAAVPPFIARGATVISLGCGIGLLLIGFRLVDRHVPDR